VRNGLLDVDVLAAFGRPDRGQRVPVVGRGDHDRGHGFVVEHLADVGLGHGRRSGILQYIENRLHHRRIGIDQVRDLDARGRDKHRSELLSAHAQSHDRDAHLLVGLVGGAGVRRGGKCEGRRGEELAAGGRHWQRSGWDKNRPLW
jgi:hypothetical protein